MYRVAQASIQEYETIDTTVLFYFGDCDRIRGGGIHSYERERVNKVLNWETQVGSS